MTADLTLGAVGEEIRDEWTVAYGGRVFHFPGTLSVNALKGFAPDVDRLMAFASGANPNEISTVLDLIESVLRPLAGPDQTAEILEHVGVEDVEKMLVWLFGKYGLGEAEASQRSSKNTGKRSRPTSNASTGSTSDGSSTDPSTPTASSA